jgi:hypothetical protein
MGNSQCDPVGNGSGCGRKLLFSELNSLFIFAGGNEVFDVRFSRERRCGENSTNGNGYEMTDYERHRNSPFCRGINIINSYYLMRLSPTEKSHSVTNIIEFNKPTLQLQGIKVEIPKKRDTFRQK